MHFCLTGDKYILFQSTPSQRGRLDARVTISNNCFISIHALAKRATPVQTILRTRTAISIHALAKRATRADGLTAVAMPFQSTPSQRGRQMLHYHADTRFLFQSTPSQRGRHAVRQSSDFEAYFNPRPRKEGDYGTKYSAVAICCLFQSTPSQRGRRAADFVQTVALLISIHALAKRATRYYARQVQSLTFQSTPSQRGRRQFADFIKQVNKFQSTPSQRGRLYCAYGSRIWTRFQSTPSQRGRLTKVRYNIDNETFQSTPSQRGRPELRIALSTSTLISIHALAKRATLEQFVQPLDIKHFNPRPRKEGDLRGKF